MDIGGMKHRVRCLNSTCGAHRDLAVSARCGVCGAVRYAVVQPTAGDLALEHDLVTHELVECAELVDTAINDRVSLDPEHPVAVRLKLACRRRAYLAAGLIVDRTAAS